MLTPPLVRRHLRAGQVYRSGPRRWVRVLRILPLVPCVEVRPATRAGGRVRGERRDLRITVYPTWSDGRWTMPRGYELVTDSRRRGALSSPTTPRRAAHARTTMRR